ncbi:MFS transporter [Streptosporangium nondiastaticum]|uniref:MFS transporter n=1 Tax=Streptosporangium nondiastaticum TaxID=35764 RepID=A0A9X7JNP4_9ACTN|nr:MFS transporter [Streptosporangium nondiastaticum]PSJ27109.1 MFS transporter [Streptosporangium nondiastaticum]
MAEIDPSADTSAPPPGGRLRALLPDASPLRSSRDFRRLWLAGSITAFGTYLTLVAVPMQLKELTGSTLAVGAVGAVELVPMIVFGLYGGALADAVDRRKLILWCELGLSVLVGVLAVNAMLPSPMVWPLYVIAGLVSTLASLQRPALHAMVPRVGAHDQLMAAGNLESVRWQVAAIAGPGLAGVVAAFAGVQIAYGLDALTYVVSAVLMLKLAPCPPAEDAEKASLRGVLEGARYAWQRKDLLGTYVMDVAAMFFAHPEALFVFLVTELDTPWALGLLWSASAVGSLLMGLASGWTSRVHRHGLLAVCMSAAWGAAIAAAGMVHNIWLVLAALVVAGGFDMLSGLFRTTMWNQTIPDELRGRLAGIEMLSYMAGPQLGQVRAGGMAGIVGIRGAIASGGLACVTAVGLVALALPKLLTYDARTSEDARRVREQQACAAEATA